MFLQVSWRTSQSSSLDVGCLLFCSLSRWCHTASVMVRSGFWREQSMTDSVPWWDILSRFCVTALVVQYIWNHWHENEGIARWMLSRWYCLVGQNLTAAFCVLNINRSFDKIPYTTGWNAAPKPRQSPTCFLKIRFVKVNSNWIHPSIRPVAPDFQSTSCVIWHSSAFSSCFPSWRLASWQPSFMETIFNEALMNSRWISWRSRCISQVLCQVFAGFLPIPVPETVHLL